MSRLTQLLGSNEIDASGRFIAYCALFALIAGGGKAMLHRKPGTRWHDIVAAAVGSCVAGVATGAALLYIWPTNHQLLIFSITGVAGWCGSTLLDIAANAAIGRVRNAIRNESSPD